MAVIDIHTESMNNPAVVFGYSRTFFIPFFFSFVTEGDSSIYSFLFIPYSLFFSPPFTRRYPPLGQWIPLHRPKHIRLEMRIRLRQLPDQLLDLLPLGMVVGGTFVMDNGQPLLLGKGADVLFLQIEHGADLGHIRAIQMRHGLEAADSRLEQKAHEECLHCVVIVVAQGDFVNALLPDQLIQGAPAHLCAHGAGIFLVAVVENDRADLRFHHRIRNVQAPAECLHPGKVHAREPQVDGHGLQIKMLGVILFKLCHEPEERQGILAAADADGDFVAVLDHIVILHATAQKSCHSLHKYASRKQKSHVRFRA